MLAYVAWKRWRQAQAAMLWRVILCVIAASILTPCIIDEGFGGIETVDVYPAALGFLVGFAAALIGGDFGAVLEAPLVLAPVLGVALILTAIWSKFGIGGATNNGV
jgi:hypothetical protein